MLIVYSLASPLVYPFVSPLVYPFVSPLVYPPARPKSLTFAYVKLMQSYRPPPYKQHRKRGCY